MPANRWLGPMVVIAWCLLAAAGLARHALNASNLFDMGIFDQAIWLIAHGLPPNSTTLGFHILGDHAAVVLYPLAILYWLPRPLFWLLCLQALALALIPLPIFRIARQAGLDDRWALAVSAASLLYPAVFNLALDDFHPEVLAVPLLLHAAWAGLEGRHGEMIVCLAASLACKEVLGLTVAGLGAFFWLAGRKPAGIGVFAAGLAWFGFAAGWIVPHFSGQGPGALARYAWLARADLRDLAWQLVGPPALGYLVMLVAPVALALKPRYAWVALPALPMVLLNLLSAAPEQRDLLHQYTASVFPFLLLWQIRSLADATRVRAWHLGVWATAGFLALAKYGYFATDFQVDSRILAAEHAAIRAINGPGGVLAPSHLCPHLAHRVTIEMLRRDPGDDLARFSYVVLDLPRPGWGSDAATQQALTERLLASPDWSPLLNRDGVSVFARIAVAKVRQYTIPVAGTQVAPYTRLTVGARTTAGTWVAATLPRTIKVSSPARNDSPRKRGIARPALI
jgi:uncharacterized membrane protein